MAEKDYVARRISEASGEPYVDDAHLDALVHDKVSEHPGKVKLLRGDIHGGFTTKMANGKEAPAQTHADADKWFPKRIREELHIGHVMLIRWMDNASFGCYIRAIEHHANEVEMRLAWIHDRVGTRYVKGGHFNPGADCSSTTAMSTQYSTKGQLVLPMYSVSQYYDARLDHVPLSQVKRGDILAVKHPSDSDPPGHVATVNEVNRDGTYNVIDEEPGTLINPSVPGGLYVRPGTHGYWCGPEFVIACMRVPARFS